MRKFYKSILPLACLSATLLVGCDQGGSNQPDSASSDERSVPHLEKRGQATQLIVDGKPFLVLGGELHNSSATNAAYLRPLLPRLDTMHLNTVLAAVTWELTEPEKGKYDFSLVDSILTQARANHLHVALLWFGTWKNGLSHYVPAWMKTDYKTYPRMHIKGGYPVESISPLCAEALKADAGAFAALMDHVKTIDAQHTVVMMQVENEVGLLGDSRDRGPEAEKAWAAAVPAELISYLQKNKGKLLPETDKLWAANGYQTQGTWAQVFGNTPQAEEAFMAWNYSHYVNSVAAAGKAKYALPMFVNTWIVQPDDKGPGDYPAGGPQAHVHDFWRAGGSAIDLLTPDVYLDKFDEIAQLYSRNGNSLFVPESKADEKGAANAFFLIGAYKAIGFSPFGIDDRIKDAVKDPVPQAFDVLQQLSPEILEAQSTGKIAGIWLNTEKPTQSVTLGNYRFDVAIRTNRDGSEKHDAGYGLIIQKGPDEFIIAGKYLQINFVPQTAGPQYVGYSLLDEGKYVNGQWTPGRRLNGDDIMLDYHIAQQAAIKKTGSVVRTLGDKPSIMRVKLYRFE
ncbi:beta-galactosidase-like protein [Mucilaginibacter yixingensis]|uniref:Beta-galactosidase-like protein n=1 Tax=Mucilaginibacter yixingensis TaxID=1295612 RepID=A0A2T5J6Q3_9SPHI|nr:DUF5597 domain-containing protein [Mucilaginibacter yixingensis]PTQ94824.1 beta-galactosidase-like protein [Mucilaginibacter yixingensis]